MKNVKTYEGFLDFFKRKPKSTEPVYMDDIKECGFDLLHDSKNRIDVYTDRRPGGVKHDYDDIFGIKRGMDSTHDYEDLMNDILELPPNVRDNKMIIEFRYYLSGDKGISKNEMSEILKEFVDKLQILNSTASFYLSWGYEEGHIDNKEYKNIDKMLDVIYKKDRTPLIAMKITAPSDIIVD